MLVVWNGQSRKFAILIYSKVAIENLAYSLEYSTLLYIVIEVLYLYFVDICSFIRFPPSKRLCRELLRILSGSQTLPRIGACAYVEGSGN